MGKRALTQEDYDNCLKAFRERPGNFSHAAKTAGIWHGTAKVLWEDGKPSKNWPPLRDVILSEQRQARAMLEAADKQLRDKVRVESEQANLSKKEEALRLELERQKASNDIARSRAEEATMVRGARQNIVGLMGVSAQLISGGLKLADRLKKTLESSELSPVESTKILQSIASITRQANEAGKVAMAMERIHVGEPTETKEVRVTNMSLMDVKEEIEAAAAELKQLDEEGIIDIEALEQLKLDE